MPASTLTHRVDTNITSGTSARVSWPGADFRLSQILPGSVYLWACGERHDGEGVSDVSLPERCSAWVVLIVGAESLESVTHWSILYCCVRRETRLSTSLSRIPPPPEECIGIVLENLAAVLLLGWLVARVCFQLYLHRGFTPDLRAMLGRGQQEWAAAPTERKTSRSGIINTLLHFSQTRSTINDGLPSSRPS